MRCMSYFFFRSTSWAVCVWHEDRWLSADSTRNSKRLLSTQIFEENKWKEEEEGEEEEEEEEKEEEEKKEEEEEQER